MRLLELTPTGARIEHSEPLRGSSSFPMHLPRALGGGRVQVEVIRWQAKRETARQEGFDTVGVDGETFT
jgi:hypothetical protein